MLENYFFSLVTSRFECDSLFKELVSTVLLIDVLLLVLAIVPFISKFNELKGIVTGLFVLSNSKFSPLPLGEGFK